MLQYERFENILNKLQTQSSVRVTELAGELGVSESTIRRDIVDLAKAGRVRKVFGGAVPIDAAVQEPAGGEPTGAGKRRISAPLPNIQEKVTIRVDEKAEVAAYAASLIRDGDLIYIDAGSTTGSMIDHITCKEATYVTNGTRHAIRLAARGLKTYLLSGRVKATTEAVIGYDAVGSLQKYHFSKCFIGTDGIDEESGFTTADIDESMVKTEAIGRSGQVHILADSSKFGRVAAVTFAPLSAGTIITDHLTDENYRAQAEIIEVGKRK